MHFQIKSKSTKNLNKHITQSIIIFTYCKLLNELVHFTSKIEKQNIILS